MPLNYIEIFKDFMADSQTEGREYWEKNTIYLGTVMVLIYMRPVRYSAAAAAAVLTVNSMGFI